MQKKFPATAIAPEPSGLEIGVRLGGNRSLGIDFSAQ
jgi:hypothetical protein